MEGEGRGVFQQRLRVVRGPGLKGERGEAFFLGRSVLGRLCCFSSLKILGQESFDFPCYEICFIEEKKRLKGGNFFSRASTSGLTTILRKNQNLSIHPPCITAFVNATCTGI